MFSLIRGVAALCLLILPTAALAEWREARSPHFVVLSEGPERDLVRMTQRLEAVHWMMGLVTGVTPTADVQPVRIYLVDNLASVRRAIGDDRSSRNVAGFYRPLTTGAIAVVPRSEGQFSTVVLYHEYAHHFLMQYLDIPVPGWLNEGFAEFISTASFERDGHIAIGHVARHREGELFYGEWIPLRRMLAPPDPNDRRAGVASYGQAWILTHYLISTDARRQQLNQFTRALTAGTPMADATAVFGDLNELDASVRAYSRRGSLTARLAPLPPGVMAAPAVRVLRPAEAALIPLELRAAQRLDDEEKATLLTDLAAIAARHPGDPAPALLQTQMLFDAERWADAAAAADRVLALDPANVRAKGWKGWALIRAMEAEGRLAPADVTTARRLIVAANRAAPDDPIPLLAYYNSFLLAGQELPEVAAEGLYRAAVLLPNVDEVRMNAAMALLARRSFPRARHMLAPLAFSPHPTPQQAYAMQLIGWIDSGGAGDVPAFVDVPVTVEGMSRR